MVSSKPTVKGSLSNIFIRGSLVPDSNIEYDLGSPIMKWRDLFLSGNTVNLGDTTISRDKTTGGLTIENTDGLDSAVKMQTIIPAVGNVIDLSGAILCNVSLNAAKIISNIEQLPYVIEQIRATNDGTAVPFKVNETGPHHIADFQYLGNSALKITQGGPVVVGHINTVVTGKTVHVYGDTEISGNLTINGTQTIMNTNVNTTDCMTVTNDGTGPAVVLNQTGDQPIIEFQDDGVSVFKIVDGGNVGVGTTLPSQKVHVVGTAFSTNGFISYSDARIKTNVVEINDALMLVKQLRGVRYERVDEVGPRRVGLIAQEVETVLPEVVKTDASGMKSVEYDNIVSVLVQAIKEQKLQLTELNAQYKKL